MSVNATADNLVLIEGVAGYQGVQDNTIYSESNSLSNGGGDHLFAGATGREDDRRALIRFDLEDLPLPPDAVITGVSLQLTISRTRAFQPPLAIHRLLSPWGEGNEDAGGAEGQGTNGNVGSATLSDNYYTQSQWNTPGGDFVAAASASVIGGRSGEPVVWSTSEMFDDLQAWLADPSSNFGWIVRGDETSVQTAVRFFSADNNENSIAEQWPRLTIEYESGPMGLEVTELRRGQRATITATNVVPGARVYFLYSFAGPGSTFVPQLGIELDLDTPIVNFANSVANASGVASISQTVPNIAPLRPISFQAVHLRSFEVARKSDRVDTEILP